EHHRDDGQAPDRLGAQRFHVAEAVDHRLDGQRDEQFNLLWRQAGALGLDRHLRLDEVREDIQLGVAGDVKPVPEQDAREHDDHAAILEREMDERLKHLDKAEHPTSNIELPTSKDCSNGRHWMLDVGCWMLDVPRIHGTHSPPPCPLSSMESNCCAPVVTTWSLGVAPLVTNQPASVG